MIRKLLLLTFLLFSIPLFGQRYKGELTDNKGEVKEINFVRPYSLDNYKSLLFLRYGTKLELFATNYQRAKFSNKIVYGSIKPQLEGEKVWAQLHFESDNIKLYLRYNKFYIEIKGKLFNISKIQRPQKLNLPIELQNYWKNLLGRSKRIPFNEVKMMLVDYHKEKNFPYFSYFPEPDVVSEFEAGFGVSHNQANLLINSNEEMDLNCISPALFANVNIYFPRFMKHAYLSAGLMMEKYNLGRDQKLASNNVYDLDLEFYQLALPLSCNLRLKKISGFDIYARLGAKIYSDFGIDSKLIAEIRTHNIVRIEPPEMSIDNSIGFAPLAGFFVDKKIGKRKMSFAFMYEKYLESRNSFLIERKKIKFSQTSIRFSVALKF